MPLKTIKKRSACEYKTCQHTPFPPRSRVDHRGGTADMPTCIQLAMYSDLRRDIPFIPFFSFQCFLPLFSHPFKFYLIIVKLESSRRERNLNFPASPLRRAGRQGPGKGSLRNCLETLNLPVSLRNSRLWPGKGSFLT